MNVRSDVQLAEWCTLDVGGPARWFVQSLSEDDVLDALAWADQRHVPALILGGGSNVVIADSGFRGLVVQIAIGGVQAREDGQTVTFDVGAGEPWDAFVARTVADNCAGLECLSGIPGLVGGTPVQNVGAYGQEVSDTIIVVRAIDCRARQRLTMSTDQCAFGYRTSRFKHGDAGKFVVTGVTYVLERDGRPTIAYADVIKYFQDTSHTPTLAEVRQAIIEIRSRKGMVIREGNPANRSCGSFFVNPIVSRDHFERLLRSTHVDAIPHYAAGEDDVKVPAAWLIEHAGYERGYVNGPVGISPYQAQGLINRGGASADDVVALALSIKRAVWSIFRVALVPEPVFVGFDARPDVQWLLDPSPHGD
jgi:UDP-N-acetylmuramate dehydrogenase